MGMGTAWRRPPEFPSCPGKPRGSGHGATDARQGRDPAPAPGPGSPRCKRRLGPDSQRAGIARSPQNPRHVSVLLYVLRSPGPSEPLLAHCFAPERWSRGWGVVRARGTMLLGSRGAGPDVNPPAPPVLRGCGTGEAQLPLLFALDCRWGRAPPPSAASSPYTEDVYFFFCPTLISP